MNLINQSDGSILRILITKFYYILCVNLLVLTLVHFKVKMPEMADKIPLLPVDHK